MAWGGQQKEPGGRSQLRRRVTRTEKRAKSQRIAGTKGEGIRFRHVYEKVGWGFNGGNAERRKRPLLTVGW